MKNRKLILLAAALVLLLAAAVPAYRSLAPSVVPAEIPDTAPVPAHETDAPAEETAAPETGTETAPDFTVYDAEGTEVRLSDFRGKPVVINFWATWCPPCRAELPYFDAACAAHGEDAVFLMVDLTDGDRDTVESVRAFLDETGFAFPVYYDTELNAVYAYAVSSIPLTVLIDAQGRLVATHLGSMSETQLNALLEKII